MKCLQPSNRMAVVLCLASLIIWPRGASGAQSWLNDLSAIQPGEWTRAHAAHLLERAGFGGTPVEVDRLAAMTPEQAVAVLVDYERIPNDHVKPFEESDLPMNDLRRDALQSAMQAKAMPASAARRDDERNRAEMQAVLAAMRAANDMEMRRLTLWWGERMMLTHRPLEERMTLFWHDHFATSNQKVRDYRKMLDQHEMMRRQAIGNFGTLVRGIYRDPAMLIYLDNRVNRRNSPNENFARELLELFTMGPGNYSEDDIKQAARAFTGWTVVDSFARFVPRQHDAGEKIFLGQSVDDAEDVVDAILRNEATAQFIASKIYCEFVREDVDENVSRELARILRDGNYELKPLLRTIFLSRDFYAPETLASRVKSPVDLVISTYRKLGLSQLPTVPDFGDLTRDMGQHLFHPPNVAGWPSGLQWIDPASILLRGNFARSTLFPDQRAAQRFERIQLAARQMPMNEPQANREGARLTEIQADDPRSQMTIEQAVRQGRLKAAALVKPIPAVLARVETQALIGDARTPMQIVDRLCQRFLSTPLEPSQRQELADFYQRQLQPQPGRRARELSGSDAALRQLLHLILSLPEYQLS